MLSDLSDEKLAELALEGDADAFAQIVRRWDRRIFALCYGMLGREEDARDCTQEAFVAAYRNLNNFRGDARVSSWLHRIAINQCLSLKRRQRVRPEDLVDDSDPAFANAFKADGRTAPSILTERCERIRVIRQAVGALPVELRQVVVMKEFEEMTFQEISETLDMPLSTVKSRLYNALRQLKMRLEDTPVEVS